MRLSILLAAAGVLAGPAIADDCDPQETAKLLPESGDPLDQFGSGVAMEGDVLVVGERFGDGGGTDSGAVRVLRETDAGWVEIGFVPGTGPSDYLGRVAAISGGTAIAGAPECQPVVCNQFFGPGYASILREGGDGTWAEVATLTASDGVTGDGFGFGVDIDGDTAIVGALRDDDNGVDSGSAYIFREGGDGTWTEIAKLTAADGAAGDLFGGFVAISGGTAIVGAVWDDDNGPLSGSAYVFRETEGGDWVQIDKLVASDGADGDRFGIPDIDGDTAVVSAFRHGELYVEAGAAYVFRDDGTGDWAEIAKLAASDQFSQDWFGACAAIEGDNVLIGAVQQTNGGAGAAYLFREEGGAWGEHEHAKLTASDAATADLFGFSVGLSEGRAAVGAIWNDDHGENSGAAYVFDLGCACPADANGDGELNVLDFVAFQSLWQDQAPSADCDGSGAFDVLDFVCFQEIFQAGCP